MKEDKRIKELQKERKYLSDRLEEAAKEIAKLDLLNLTLTQQKRQAVAAFNFINVMQEKIEEALTIDDLYSNIVKALTTDLFMDSSSLLRIDFNTRDIFILASSGLTENLKYLKLDENISKKEVLNPTFVNSKSSLHAFHTFVVKSFEFPFFIWHPIVDEEDSLIVLFVGNRFEDLVSKQPFSEASLETLGAISSVISLRRDNIVKTHEMLKRKSEKIDFLAKVMKTSPISVITTDLDGKIIYVNSAMEKLYGYEREELLGKNPLMFNAEPKADEIQMEIIDTIRQRKVWKGELLNKKKNGELFYINVSIYPVLDREGNFIAFVGFQEDITERKKTEKALRESKELFEKIFFSQQDAIFILDSATPSKIIDINPCVTKVFGYTRQEIIGKTTDILHVDNTSLKEFRKYLYPAIAEHGFLHLNEYQMKRKDGTVFTTEHSVMPLEDEHGKHIGWVSVVRDITERKRAQEQLQNLSRRLMEVQESERRFLTSELHDQVGQNLTALNINLNIIRSQFSKEVDKKIVDRIEDSMKLVEETIERMRNVMAGLRPPVLDDYGLGVALRWYTERFSERTGVATILQERELSPRLPIVVETELFRIVQEVLTNVAKHADARQAIITLERVDGMVQLVISDDGVGFDPAVLRQLKEQPGWGLITIKERAKALGGDVYMKSAHGKGTQVIVQVPC